MVETLEIYYFFRKKINFYVFVTEYVTGKCYTLNINYSFSARGTQND